MNDNMPTEKQDWITIVEQEWGFRPVSCVVDAPNKTVVATFQNPLNVSGEMRIHGITIIPQVMPKYVQHPFNAVRSRSTTRPHRVRTQHML